MRRQAFTWLEAVAILVILAILAAILFPIFGRSRETGHGRASCTSNLKQIGLAFKQYVQDNDEKFPLVNAGQAGWMDIVQPYIKSLQLFQCPQETSGAIIGKSDYFYNSRLAGQPERKFNFIANTIMSGDGTGESPSNASLSRFPSNWATDSNSPAWRHLQGANYGFADGHVKWFRPSSVTNDKPHPTVNTFAPW